MMGGALRRHPRATFGLLLALATCAVATAVENTWDFSVQVTAVVQPSPAQITLTWPQDTNGVPSSYTIYRKAPAANRWGTGTTISGYATNFVDGDVAAGVAYEYRIV